MYVSRLLRISATSGKVPPPWLRLRSPPRIHPMLQVRFRIRYGRRQPRLQLDRDDSFAAHQRPHHVSFGLHRECMNQRILRVALERIARQFLRLTVFPCSGHCGSVQYRSPSYRHTPKLLSTAQIDFLKLFPQNPITASPASGISGLARSRSSVHRLPSRWHAECVVHVFS